MRRPRRPRDPNQLAKVIVDIATGEAVDTDSSDETPDPSKNPHAVALGVAVADLVAHFELHGSGPTEKQIRASLKNLITADEAIRVDRGTYLSRGASESRGAEKPGDDAPGSLNLLAAE